MRIAVVGRLQCEAMRKMVFSMRVVKDYMLAGGRAL